MFESSTISIQTSYDLVMQMGTLLGELFYCAAEVTYEELPSIALDYACMNEVVSELMESVE